MTTSIINTLDPIDGLTDYVLFTKPYHSKILEVLVEYIYTDCIDVTITENFNLSLGMPDTSLLPLWGWSIAEAQEYFNCDFQIYQVCNIDIVNKFFQIVGDFTGDFAVGTKFIYQYQPLEYFEFTITGITTNIITVNSVPVTKTQLTVSEPVVLPGTSSIPISNSNFIQFPGNGSPLLTTTTGSPLIPIQYYWAIAGHFVNIKPGDTFQVTGNTGLADNTYTAVRVKYDNIAMETRVFVDNDLSAATDDGDITLSILESVGTIIPGSCYTKNDELNVYTFNAGIVWPSPVHVDQNVNCGGYGILWDSEDSLLGTVLNPILTTEQGHPDIVLPGSPALDPGIAPHFEINNTFGLPLGAGSPLPTAAEWASVYVFGATFEIVNSTGNNGVYTVLYSELTGSVLRLFVTGCIDSNINDGEIRFSAQSTGYDLPNLCINDGQGLGVNSGIKERLIIEINNNDAIGAIGYDLQPWDINGFDGGSFTFIAI